MWCTIMYGMNASEHIRSMFAAMRAAAKGDGATASSAGVLVQPSLFQMSGLRPTSSTARTETVARPPVRSERVSQRGWRAGPFQPNSRIARMCPEEKD